MEFIEAPLFMRWLPNYLSDDEYRELQLHLVRDPEAGTLIPGTGGFRKLRWTDRRRGKGKRGGLRIVYYHFGADAQIWLMTLYDKDEAADLTATEKRALKTAIETEPAASVAATREGARLMAKRGRPKPRSRRSLFQELTAGVEAMGAHREGRLTLRTTEVGPIHVPPIDPDFVRETRESFHMSRQVFAFKIGVNPRTLERWEQGRSKPNEQAAVLIWLVRRYPDTLRRLESLGLPA